MADGAQTLNEWSELVPGGVVVYYADGDEEILHVNQYVLDLFECNTMAEFMELTGGTFRGFVHDTDKAFTEDSIWGQVNSRNGLDHIYYRIKTKTGATVSVDDYGRLVQNEGERPKFYVFVVKIDRDYVIDWLTGLPGMDRFLYMADLESAALISRSCTPALVVFDLMGMKAYNASYGRDEGDRLLSAFASILRHHFGSELCCRTAGDTFCTLCDADGLDKNVQSVFEELALRGTDKSLPVMAGACEIHKDEELSLVLDRAKSACDSDRSTWESHLTWYTNAMREDALIRSYVLEHVDEAIKKRWLRPYYQGLVRSASGAVCGQEALARWIDPVHGFLSPAQFIPTLEDAGLLSKLDLHIIECVLCDMHKKLKEGTSIVPVSVNVSLRDLGTIDLAKRLSRMADAVEVPHDLLCIEFTESAATADPEALRSQIKKLHAAGFPVWMDDFGSGFSSLNNLGSFDFDLLKLDMGFLYDTHREKSRVIMDGVIRAAKRMGLRTLAEGVETRDQAEALIGMGCDVLQGYYFFKPQSFEDIAESRKREDSRKLEPYIERDYWNAVSSVSLTDLAANGEGKGVNEIPTSELPAGVCELRDGNWWMLRENDPLHEALEQMGVQSRTGRILGPYDVPLFVEDDENFLSAIDRCKKSGAWERISTIHKDGLRFQFYVSHLAACNCAEAYVIVSTPNLLGAALGTYGDIPVGYAVLRVICKGKGTEAVDAEYVYANDHYRSYGEFGTTDLAGKTITQGTSVGGEWLLPYCYRAAILQEHIQEVVYNKRLGHWLSLSVVPSFVPDCCVLAFTFADAEQQEREEMTVGIVTSELIIATANALNTEHSYDEAMGNLLEAMSQVIHPDRLYIYERGATVTSNTFEWCAPGIEPQINNLQNMPNDEFAVWDRLLSRQPVVVITNVNGLARTSKKMYERLKRQGVKRLLVVPLYAGKELIGYLGADNYILEERLDTHRLLSTIASFVGARITHQRMLVQVERLHTRDELTGLLNRRGIDEAIRARMQEHPGTPFAIALVRVDDFRALNDLYGRDVGDQALRFVANKLANMFPSSAIIGRNGGDEVLVALFGEDTYEMAESFETLAQSIMEFELDNTCYAMSLSVGYELCDDGHDIKRTYTHADEALFAAQSAGGSICLEWNPSLQKRVQRPTYRYAGK